MEELFNRIKLAIECGSCVIDMSLRGFCEWDAETGVLVACPGVAVAIVGTSPNSQFIDRRYRAVASGMEWHYMMHFEQAINYLFCGRIYTYNDIASKIGLPQLRIIALPSFDENKPEIFISQIKKLI